MASIGLEYGVYDLTSRNRAASQSIARYATLHGGTDVALGLLGFLPIPGAGPLSMVAALCAQIPIYTGMAGELQSIYQKPSMDFEVQRILGSGIRTGSALELGKELVIDPGIDIAVHAGIDMSQQFGQSFFQEIGGEIARELAAGFALAFIPILGGFVSTGLDLALAVTMTWRVGTMVSMYYQNGGAWVGDRHETYERAKELTGGVSIENTGRVNLDGIPSKVERVKNYQVSKLAEFVDSLLEVAPDLTDNKIRSKLQGMGVPADVIEGVIRRVRG